MKNIPSLRFSTVTAIRAGSESSAADLLQNKTQRMGEILSAVNLGCWVTLVGNTIAVGDRSHLDKSSIEFIFESERRFLKTFDQLRLAEFARAYFDGGMHVVGPIEKAMEILDAVNRSTDKPQTFREYFAILLFRVSKAIIPQRALKFESLEHYSQSAKAYELFLDRYMQYTCGRFENGSENIDQAQTAKFRFIESLYEKHAGDLRDKSHLDIGCGWGGMTNYFQTHFGTRSIGNTNCADQKAYAESRFGGEIVLGDFSSLKKTDQRFDLITVVGMIEHLTPHRRTQLLKTIYYLLKPNGIFYLQCIAKPSIWIGGDAYRVAQREVFPGHFLETSEETDRRLNASGFSILERFDHCRDYGLTTSRWIEKIQQNEEGLAAILGQRNYRVYLGYLAFASTMFSTGRGSLLRYLVRKN